MASGTGINGGQGRCYPIWLDYTKCIAESLFPKDCHDYREDYIECLHHYKEAMRRAAIAKQVEHREKVAAEIAAQEAAAAKQAGNASKPS